MNPEEPTKSQNLFESVVKEAPTPSREPANRSKRRFSVGHVLLPVLAVGSLVAIQGPSRWSSGRYPSSTGIARTQLHNFGQAIDMFKLHHKHFPDSLEALTRSTPDDEPFFESIPYDPWGTPFAYNTYKEGAVSRFRISSAGPNSEHGDEDDVIYPRPRRNVKPYNK